MVVDNVPCPCCGKGRLHPLLEERLLGMEVKLGDSLVITSGYRCPKHNAEIGGAKFSAHAGVEGQETTLAADISCRTSTQRFALVDAAIGVGFSRVGVYLTQKCVHVDVGDAVDPHTWAKNVMWVSS